MTPAAPSDTRERIYDTALALFQDDGYESVAVSRITREAGVAKGTFFNHFPTKDHILSEVFHRTVNGALGDVTGLRLAGTDAVLEFTHALVAHLARHRTLSEAVVLRLSSLPAPEPDPPRERAVSETEEAPTSLPGTGRGPPADPPRHHPRPRDEQRIRRWIEARLGEAIQIAVPLVPVAAADLAFALTWCLLGTLDEWARSTDPAADLHRAAQRRLAYLLESAGLPANRQNARSSTRDTKLST